MAWTRHGPWRDTDYLPNWADTAPWDPVTERGESVVGAPRCRAMAPNTIIGRFVCTRPPGHTGRHVAHYDSDQPIVAWYDEGDGIDIIRMFLAGVR